MENATKALLMATAILIAVVTLGIFIYMYNDARVAAKEREKIETSEQMTEFNNQFESYNRKLMRGVEVISVLNKAIDNNLKFEAMDLGWQFDNYKVIVEVHCLDELGLTTKLTYTSDKYSLDTQKFYDDYEKIKNDNSSEEFKDLKKKVFNCVELKNNSIGRIYKLVYKEIDISKYEV